MDIRDLIQKADAYGKQSEQTQKQIEEGLLDWFKEKLGLGDTAAQAAVAAAQATGADPEETPTTPAPSADAQATADNVAGGNAQGGEFDTAATADDTAAEPQQPATADDATANPEPEQNQKDLMTRYNEGGKQAMPEIEKLQQDLKDLGFDPNGVDGKYGNGTFKAVQEFQKANGLQVDGQAGPATLAKIEQVKAGGAVQGDSAADVAQDDAARGSDTAQANPTPTDGDPGETQANAPDAETQRLIDELNDLINQMMPRGQTVSASADQDSITAMRGAINLAESLVREATEEQKAKLGDLLSQLGNTNWAQSNADAYQTIMNRANAAMASSPSATRASAPATPNATTADAGGATDAERAAGAGQAKAGGTRGPAGGPVPTAGGTGATASGDQGDGTRGPAGGPVPTAAAGVANGYTVQGGDASKGPAGGPVPTAPKVSKETFIQMAPNRPADQANMNVSQMKAKYPTPYVDIPNKDGTVTRGYGPLKNLQDFVANKGKRLNAKIVGQQNASKEYDMTKKINEGASMNITADNASELAELLNILKNAGMPNAAPVADMHIDMPMAHDAMHTDIDSHKQGPMPCATCGGDHGEDTPCGGGEDWDNAPDEGYSDMMDIIKLSGGPNSNKNPGDIRVKDPRQNDEAVAEATLPFDRSMFQNPEYKAWSRVYGDDPEAAEKIPGHEEFLKMRQANTARQDMAGELMKANEPKYMEILKNLLRIPVKSSAEFRDYMDAEFEKDDGFRFWLGSGPGKDTPQGKYAIDLYYSNNEEVEEDGWDNSPDEEYKDDDYMYQSGGIHKKKKSHPPVAGGDNPMALENSIKAQLYKALEEKLQNK